jgi:hypothetical protein
MEDTMGKITMEEAKECSAGPCDSCSHYYDNGGNCKPVDFVEESLVADFDD